MADNPIGAAGGIIGGFIQQLAIGLQWNAESTAINQRIRTAQDNADAAASASADAIARGNREGGLLRLRASQYGAQVQSAYQGGGVDPTVGTPASNAAYIEASGEQDAQTAANNAWREAFGYKKQQTRFTAERDAARREYDSAALSYALTSTGSAVKTVGSVAGMAG